MSEVLIDGVPYAPVQIASETTSTSTSRGSVGAFPGGATSTSSSGSGSRIGLAVTTHNRPETLARFMEQVEQFTTGDFLVMVVDDASTKLPDTVADFRFDENVGIAKAKNKCIELLMEHGCEHLFIFDDDTWPIAEDWWKPYVEHSEPHLMYLFKDPGKRPGQPPLSTPATLYDDGSMYALGWPRGCMLYVHRSAVERVGGYRPEFGVWGWEHYEYSERIHNAGLTLMPFQDVCGSDKLIHCVDQTWDQPKGFTRSVDTRTRERELKANEKVYEQFKGTADYVEYRDLPNLVLTVCLTKVPDPQPSRKGAAKLTAADFQVWEDSIKGAKPVVLSDTGFPAWEKVPSGLNPYAQRWVSYYQYLRDHPAKWVWLTDGTDVEMLRQPWDEMEPGKLYVGWEPKVVGDKWLADHHYPYKDWIDGHGGLMLLNAGVCGGDHLTVLDFCHDMAHEVIRTDHSKLAGDMACFNYIAYSDKWRGKVFTGPLITTVFKANERNGHSYWKHK